MSAKNGTPPVIERLADLRRQLADTDAARVAAEAALRSGTGDAEAVVRAEARAPVLRKAIAELEQQLTAEREAAGESAGGVRLTAVRRAHGSLMDQYEQDVARLREAAAGYVEAGSRVGERVEKLRMLGAEQSALLDRFPGLSAPPLPTVTPPGRHEGVAAAVHAVDGVGFRDHLHVTPAVEDDAQKIRRRRTYAEITNTPGAEIIMAAGGPKPWPALTPQQEEIIAGRERQRAQESLEMQRFAAEGDRGLQRSTL